MSEQLYVNVDGNIWEYDGQDWEYHHMHCYYIEELTIQLWQLGQEKEFKVLLAYTTPLSPEQLGLAPLED